MTILEPSQYQHGKISSNHHKVIVCDNTIEKEHWEKVQNQIKKLQKNKSDNYKEKIDSLKKEQFILAPDNLDVLNNLLCDKTIMQDNNGIDIIYIDPPYNTGDATLGYRDLRDQNEWLNFMKARLEKAYDLLSDNGIIFISIDDTMQAYLKIVCDEVFGINKFVGNIIWNKQNFQYGAHNIQKNHEYILVYSKNDISDKKMLFTKDSQELVLWQDKRGTYTREYSFDTSFGGDKLIDRPTMGYIFYYNPKTNEKIISDKYVHDIKIIKKNDLKKVYKFDKNLINKGFTAIIPPFRKGEVLGRWCRGLQEAKKLLSQDLLDFVWSNKNKSYKIYPKKYIKESSSKINDYPIKSMVGYPSSLGTKVLGKILGNKIFANPKPVELIKYLISSYKGKQNPLVLDFFAGSGTTAQAVLELNNEDKQNRKFIVVTKKYDFIASLDSWENIGDNIMTERIFRIVYGTDKNNKKLSNDECEWLKENSPYNVCFDCLTTKQYDISLKSDINPLSVIDLSVYGYSENIKKNEKEKIINPRFSILLSHLNK